MDKLESPSCHGIANPSFVDFSQGDCPSLQTKDSQNPTRDSYSPSDGYTGCSPSEPPINCLPDSGYIIRLGYETNIDLSSPRVDASCEAGQEHSESQKTSWWRDLRRNATQSSSLLAATFIFTSSGMSLAWSTGFAPVYIYPNPGSQLHTQVCWFIAVIIGACIAALLIEKLTKRVFNYIASALVIINGILFIAAPNSLVAIVIARYCDGIAFGLTVLPTIVAGSEQSVKRFRGLVLSVERIGLVSGLMWETTVLNMWQPDWRFTANQMQGVLAVMYGVLAIVVTYLLTIETAIYYLRKDNEAEAINSLRQLQVPQIVTRQTYAALNENKHLLKEDLARGFATNVSSGLMPMLKLCLYRGFVAMSFSLPLTWGFLLASVLTIASNNMWSIFVYPVLRMAGVLIAVFTIDTAGRKVLSASSYVIGGGLLIGVGSLFSSYWSLSQVGNMSWALGLLMAYQVFAGIAAPASTCYLGEAFSISVKPYFILIAIIFENILQVIVCCAFGLSTESVSDYAYALGGLQIAFSIFFFAMMPDTKQTTLRQALARFKKSVNVGIF